jgi:cytochrome P450
MLWAKTKITRTWHEYLPKMFLVKILAGKGFAMRQVVFDAYRKYFQNIPDDTAQVFKERQRVYQETGIDELDRVKLEAAWALAIFSNTVPTTYWMIWELYWRPELLDELREEVGREAVTRSKEGGFLLDIAALKSKCRLLLSVMEETQRVRHIHATMRKVLEDTILEGRYLLKKGYVVQMPGSPIHYNTDVYGPTAGEFNPYRFVPGKAKEFTHGSGFLAWGSPPHLCPARQFASAEVLILAALLVMRFDLMPTNGEWEKNPAQRIGEIVTLLSPKKDVMMNVTVREEWSGKWSLEMGESRSRAPLASG